MRQQTTDLAAAHYDQRKAYSDAAATVAGQMWAEIDPDQVLDSWTAQLPELTAVMTGAQRGAASSADDYVDEVAASEDLAGGSDFVVDPRAFAGVSSDGRALASLLFQPAIMVLSSLAGGVPIGPSLDFGARHLETITRTQVADAGRGADGVSITTRRGLDGYVRVVQGSACSRCSILAGRHYAWNKGFLRHPNCHCTHLPASAAKAEGLIQNPMDLYSRLTARERQRAGWSLADQRAIDDGGDIFAVTNARRGVYTAGGRRFTTEGTSRRGMFGGYFVDDDGVLHRRPRDQNLTRVPGQRMRRLKTPRLTPDQIYIEAGEDRDEAIRMLRRFGYVRPGTTLAQQAARGELRLAGDLARPVAAVADPALGMTVATLKRAAADAGVPLFGNTRKADIVNHLRSWERAHSIKLPGLPEWREPLRVVSRGPAPAVIGVPPVGPVLTGRSRVDWSENLVRDHSSGRRQFVNRTGDTSPDGVRVRDLRTVLGAYDGTWPDYVVGHGTAWRIDGVSYLIEHGPADFGSKWVAQALGDLQAAHASIPAAERANRAYALVRGTNPADSYWRVKYNNPNHVSAMTAGNGQINIWGHEPHGQLDVSALRHETGHNLDSLVGAKASGSQSPAWASAVDADAVSFLDIRRLSSTSRAQGLATIDRTRGFPKGVTEYGRSSAAEDYAESVRYYQLGRIARGSIGGAEERALYFRDIYPARAAILDVEFPEIAAAQKAEIAKLLAPDLSGNTAAQLRALAKERGLSGYSGLTKAKLLELLGSGAGPAATQVVEDLAKLTVAKLRALAKGRGVKVPSTAKKADILGLLGGEAKLDPKKLPHFGQQMTGDQARARQALIDEAKKVADVSGRAHELVGNEASPAVIRQALAAVGERVGIDTAALQALADDSAALLRAADEMASRAGLTRVGDVYPAPPAPFSRELHKPIGSNLRDGQAVEIVRPGYLVRLPSGEDVRIAKAVVEESDRPLPRRSGLKPRHAAE